jgi:hypothetical protein
MTGIVVTYNTHELFKAMYESLRRWMPTMPLVIVDGSHRTDPCFAYVRALAGEINTVYQVGENIGHGLGVHYAINRVEDEQLLVMDSDIVINDNPLDAMAALLTDGVYGVGEVSVVGMNGMRSNPVCDLPFIQPYFMLMSRHQYLTHHRWIHHGTPNYRAMIDLWQAGVIGKALQPFDVRQYVFHHWAGTRDMNKKNGLSEIPKKWETE